MEFEPIVPPAAVEAPPVVPHADGAHGTAKSTPDAPSLPQSTTPDIAPTLTTASITASMGSDSGSDAHGNFPAQQEFVTSRYYFLFHLAGCCFYIILWPIIGLIVYGSGYFDALQRKAEPLPPMTAIVLPVIGLGLLLLNIPQRSEASVHRITRMVTYRRAPILWWGACACREVTFRVDEIVAVAMKGGWVTLTVEPGIDFTSYRTNRRDRTVVEYSIARYSAEHGRPARNGWKAYIEDDLRIEPSMSFIPRPTDDTLVTRPSRWLYWVALHPLTVSIVIMITYGFGRLSVQEVYDMCVAPYGSQLKGDQIRECTKFSDSTGNFGPLLGIVSVFAPLSFVIALWILFNAVRHDVSTSVTLDRRARRVEINRHSLCPILDAFNGDDSVPFSRIFSFEGEVDMELRLYDPTYRVYDVKLMPHVSIGRMDPDYGQPPVAGWIQFFREAMRDREVV